MIDFYNSSGQMLGTTSKKISGLIITEELERGWVANVELPLNHPCAQYVNEENSVKIDGQMYDIVAITEYTGEQNLISFECEHRSYRLNDYQFRNSRKYAVKAITGYKFYSWKCTYNRNGGVFDCRSGDNTKCNISACLRTQLGGQMG